MLLVLSQLLLDLYDGARERPADGFQDWVFDRIGGVMPFDAALYGRAAFLEDDIPRAVSLHPYRVRSGTLAEWEARLADVWRAARRPAPGAAVVGDDGPDGGGAAVQAVVFRGCDADAARRGQVLWASWHDPLAGTVAGVVFRRGEETGPFTEDECGFVCALLPHVATAFKLNRLLQLRTGFGIARVGLSGGAAVDGDGLLHLVEHRFACLVAREWPGWRGPLLPEPLVTHLNTTPNQPLVGRHVVFRADRKDALTRVLARPRDPLDALSPRERAVAERAANPYREIAAELFISPATVRNHLHAIYRKLGVHDRAALLERLHRHSG